MENLENLLKTYKPTNEEMLIYKKVKTYCALSDIDIYINSYDFDDNEMAKIDENAQEIADAYNDYVDNDSDGWNYHMEQAINDVIQGE